MSEEKSAEATEPAKPPVLLARAPQLVLAVGFILFVLVRIGVWVDDLPNPDIAGITYSADLILDGGLPYRDTQEFKAMGSFWLVAAIFAVLGRSMDALQLGHAVWLLVGALAVYRAARLLYPSHRLASPIATALYLVYAPMFTFNYSSWMMPAWAWAFTFGIASIEHGRRRDMLLTGVMTVLAFLIKQQATPLVLLMPAIWVWGRWRRSKGARWDTWLYWVGGGLAMWAIPVAIYASQGALREMFTGLFPFARGSEYVQASPNISTGRLIRLVARQLYRFFPVPVVLSYIALARVRWIEPKSAVIVAVFLAASIAGTAMGGARFFEHYLVQDVPAFALAAAHPAGLAGLHKGTNKWIKLIVAGFATWSIGFQLYQIGRGRGHRYEAMARRLEQGKTASQEAGRFIQERTSKDDRVQAWGWTAWRVYYWSQRRAPGRIYKPMGTVTHIHSASTFLVSKPVRLKPGPGTEAFMAEMRAHPPAFFVHSSSLVDTFGSKTDPLWDFADLVKMLDTQYRPTAKFGDLTLYQRLGSAG